MPSNYLVSTCTTQPQPKPDSRQITIFVLNRSTAVPKECGSIPTANQKTRAMPEMIQCAQAKDLGKMEQEMKMPSCFVCASYQMTATDTLAVMILDNGSTLNVSVLLRDGRSIEAIYPTRHREKQMVALGISAAPNVQELCPLLQAANRTSAFLNSVYRPSLRSPLPDLSRIRCDCARRCSFARTAERRRETCQDIQHCCPGHGNAKSVPLAVSASLWRFPLCSLNWSLST